jgi:hypothetical protein
VEGEGRNAEWKVTEDMADVVKTSLEILHRTLNGSFDLLASMADISRYAVDPSSRCESQLKGKSNLPALQFADMLYKSHAEKGLEHIMAHILLHNKGRAEPPSPSLPPPSRADTPTIFNHLTQVWLKGYSAAPTTQEECKQLKAAVATSQLHLITQRYPYNTVCTTERALESDKR